MSKIDKDKILKGLEQTSKAYPNIFGEGTSFVDDFNKLLEVIGADPSEKMRVKLEELTEASDSLLEQEEKTKQSVEAAQAEIEKLRKEGI
tara:strand:+ start:296 stop:565 length:270 start_codon:yes stop_codon:yes gene_type:complete